MDDFCFPAVCEATGATNNHLVACSRTDAIIRQGRRIQDRLGLPRWMRIFSDTDPGMSIRNIEFSANALALAAGFSLLGLLPGFGIVFGSSSAPEDTLGDILALCQLSVILGLVLPAVILLLAWIKLARNNREARATRLDEESALQSRSSFTRDEYQEVLPAVIFLLAWVKLALDNREGVTRLDEEAALQSRSSFTWDGYQQLEKMEYH